MIKGCHVYRKKELPQTLWSGGSMTELFIYPPEARFEARDFTLSVVSATIDLEESVFSDLTGYTRLIMSLDNDLELVHDGRNKVDLKKYQPHVFDGRPGTISHGKVRDYNLVIKNGQGRGSARVISLSPEGTVYAQKQIEPGQKIFEFIYALNGSYIFSALEEIEVQAGDFLVLDHRDLDSAYSLKNTGSDNCEIVISLAALDQ